MLHIPQRTHRIHVCMIYLLYLHMKLKQLEFNHTGHGSCGHIHVFSSHLFERILGGSGAEDAACPITGAIIVQWKVGWMWRVNTMQWPHVVTWTPIRNHLKMDGWKTIVSFLGWHIFRGYVSFMERIWDLTKFHLSPSIFNGCWLCWWIQFFQSPYRRSAVG